MPQASEELRAEWFDPTGEEGSDTRAIKHLKSRGFKLLQDWTWSKPIYHIFSEKDWSALDFLIDEWDFGGITQSHGVINP